MLRKIKITTVFYGALIFIILLVIATIAVFTLTKRENITPAETLKTQYTATVSITSAGFEPASLTIKKGTEITWTNDDTSPHQLQANPHPTGKSLPGLTSEILNNKQTYRYTVNKAGSFGYHDHLNPAINGNLNVKE